MSEHTYWTMLESKIGINTSKNDLSFEWGYSSGVEHSTADREVPGSIPGVPLLFSFPFWCRLLLKSIKIDGAKIFWSEKTRI